MNRRIMAAVVAIVVVAAIALLPLRLAVDRAGVPGLAARSVEGTIWRGHLVGAEWQGIALGDLDTTARMWPPTIAFTGPAISGVATATGVEALTGNIEQPGSLPFSKVRLDAVAIAFAGGGCTAASGRIAVVPSVMPMLGSLAGPLSCDGGTLRAALVPGAGATASPILGPLVDNARVDVALAADRRYRVVLSVGGVPALARALLLAAGFADTPQGLAFAVEGRL